jgi:hypothetical protein
VTRVRRQWHLIVLAAWAAVWFAMRAPHGGIAWKFFVQGTDILFTSHGIPGAHRPGLDLYAVYPQLQIGPAAYAVAEVLRQLGPDYGLVAAEIVMTGMGLLVIALTQGIAVAARPELAARPARLRRYLLVAGAFFVIAWEELAVAFGHLDDCLAITCAVAGVWAWVALRASAQVRAALTGTAIGLAAAAKPWAFVFLPVIALPLIAAPLIAAPSSVTRASVTRASVTRALTGRLLLAGPWRPRLAAVAVAAGCGAVVTSAAWLPFFTGDGATANALHYQIANMPNSALRALGVSSSRTPSWDRAVQILLGCALGAVAIVRRRWAAVILLGAGARIALDPGVHKYYTPEVMAGALLWELVGQRRAWPVWTVLGFLTLNMAPAVVSDNALLGGIRLAVVVAFTAAVLLAPARWCWRGAPDRAPPGTGQDDVDDVDGAGTVDGAGGADQQCGPAVPDALG